MSFSASARRALNTDRPFGQRVMCLHECLERFNLFGFEATRCRLRYMVGARSPGWTEAQLVEAIDALSQAKRSWVIFARREMDEQRSPLLADNPRKLSQAELKILWIEEYLRGALADLWHVANLGYCGRCGHHQIHHGSRPGCAACIADPAVRWEDRCHEKLPDPI
jgi:hypothetical protein